MRRLLFVLISALLAALFLFAFYEDSSREWTAYQAKFLNTLGKDERRGLTGGIKQIILTDLDRVDRCTTCHLAIDKPGFALAEQPFTAHPGDYLTTHPPEKFGCTVCHDGQGLATETKAAHGVVKHWEKPLKSGAMVQTSCAKCHGDLTPIAEHIPMLTKGVALYRELGCAGCHTVHGVGQTVSVDLSDMADKPWQLLDFTFVEGAHGGHGEGVGLTEWIDQHFMDPRKITPGYRSEELPAGEEEVWPSFMPNYGLSEADAKALTVYMMSLTAENLPASYVRQAPPKPSQPKAATGVERGQEVFVRVGCVGCHGVEGAGGRKNWNSVLAQEVPPLIFVKQYYQHDVESLKDLIRNGRQPAPRLGPERTRPPNFMPAWKDRVTEAEINDLVEYLFSLAQYAPAAPAEQSAQ